MRRDPARLGERVFDLLVVGGGIYGAWIAYDAALRGLSVAIVERDDWGSGTSSASSKLIHGGLRYLEHGHLGLVAKALRERARLLRLAPHRVWPLRFLLPVYGDSRAGRASLMVGLTLYDWLAGHHSGVSGHRHVARDDLASASPWLETADLRGGFLYSDAGTDDARYTLELIAGAMAHGAVAVNHASATTLVRSASGRVVGARVSDAISGVGFDVQARCTIVAAGPWAARLAGCEPGPLRLSKGAHLVMPPLPGPRDRAVLLTAASDRRVFFLIPWYGATLVGTTDQEIQGDPDRVRVEASDIDYLLGETVRRCPGLGWTRSDIRGSFVGVRTLQAGTAATVGAATREWTLVEPSEGLLVPIGGKLTSARVEAARTVDRCVAVLGLPARPTITAQRRLPWAPAEAWEDWSAVHIAEGVALGVDPQTAAAAVRRYGTQVRLLWHRVQSHPAEANRIDYRYPFCEAELTHVIQHEMALDSQDVLRRRIPLQLLGGVTAALERRVAELRDAQAEARKTPQETPEKR
jgi:glycerol-3-phosphate dehydrogenase